MKANPSGMGMGTGTGTGTKGRLCKRSIKEGKSYRELAEALGITKFKVEGYVKQAREKGELSQTNP